MESFAINEQMNQIVIEHLDPGAWRLNLGAQGRHTVADIFSHMHNVRRKWLRLSAPHLGIPTPLNRVRCSQEQAGLALAESAAHCCEMLAESFGDPDGRVKTFCRDGWANPWPAGATMAAYMITHEAHHRGQVCMLAHQLGFPLPVRAASGMWAWEKLRRM